MTQIVKFSTNGCESKLAIVLKKGILGIKFGLEYDAYPWETVYGIKKRNCKA